MINTRFKRKKLINVSKSLLDKIATSREIMTNSEKIRFMRFVWYMSENEQKELYQLV
jgi:hypothetical protein